ncbi:MAG: helix-hairpin-helix domain-containing protein [Gaiellaceae bacterium]
MLSAVPGFSATTARALLTHSGSVAEVLEAAPSEWLSVPGVGPKRATALQRTLAYHPSHVSRSRSEGPDRAT